MSWTDVADVVARLRPRLAALTERGHGQRLQRYGDGQT